MVRKADVALVVGAITITAVGAKESIDDIMPMPCTVREMWAPLGQLLAASS